MGVCGWQHLTSVQVTLGGEHERAFVYLWVVSIMAYFSDQSEFKGEMREEIS